MHGETLGRFIAKFNFLPQQFPSMQITSKIIPTAPVMLGLTTLIDQQSE